MHSTGPKHQPLPLGACSGLLVRNCSTELAGTATKSGLLTIHCSMHTLRSSMVAVLLQIQALLFLCGVHSLLLREENL